MKRNWLSKVYKMSRGGDMSLGDVVGIIRSASKMKMDGRTAKNKSKIVHGEPEPMFGGFVSIPVISRRTGKKLYSILERK